MDKRITTAKEYNLFIVLVEDHLFGTVLIILENPCCPQAAPLAKDHGVWVTSIQSCVVKILGEFNKNKSWYLLCSGIFELVGC